MNLKCFSVLYGFCFCLLYVALTACQANPFVDDKPDLTDVPTAKYDDVIKSEQSSLLGVSSQIQLALRQNKLNRAISLCKQALAKNNDDIDIHKMYAQALESKMANQGEVDELQFDLCIREWLLVMRSEVGEDSGINLAGVGGFFDFLHKDEDGYILAKAHLQRLTGSVPRPWESDNRYIRRVLRLHPSVQGKLLIGKGPQPTTN